MKKQIEERAFWAEHDSADYLDRSKAKPMIFPAAQVFDRDR
jgi:hypothetical protein